VKSAERIKSSLGANIGESMGATRRAGGTSTAAPLQVVTNRYQGLARIKGAFELPLDRVAPDPDQPRKEFDSEAIERLAGSLKQRGQIQPIRVRWDESIQTWIIIAGERRWRAARLAGLATIAAVEVQGAPTPDEVLEDQLVENCLRDDLKPIEQARAFESLMNRRSLTQAQVAERLHLSPSTISRALSLLTLPAAVQVEIDSGRVQPTVGYELAKIEDTSKRDSLTASAVRGELTQAAEVRQRTVRQKPARVEYRTSHGKVTIEVAADRDQDEAAVAALREALERAESKRHGVHQDVA
jgi:ParB family transcriptional regulator, chromosome partitioning protein